MLSGFELYPRWVPLLKLVYKEPDTWNLSKFAHKTGTIFHPLPPFFWMGKGTNVVRTILKRPWILLVVLKSPRIQFRSSPWNKQPCLRQTPFSVKLDYFAEENLAHLRCKNPQNWHVTLNRFCVLTIFYFCSLFSKAISVPHMQLQVVPSHFASKGIKECQFIK